MSERTVTIVIGAAIVAGAVYIAWSKSGGSAVASATDAGPDAPTAALAVASAAAGSDGPGDAGFDPLAQLGTLAPASTERAAGDGGVGTRMPDGTEVPPLPDKAPKSVHFGVVLVSYAGAAQAPAGARSKKDAEELARKLASDAKSDFHAAVARGDSGSADDLGRMPRGMLEAGIEYALFTLSPGQVSEPVDTPRGFWIMKRID